MQDGHAFYAYLPGGASGGILPATLDDIPLDFDTLQPYGCFIGSAAVIVLSDHDTAVDAARNMMRFFKHESCGQCTPCRNGTAKASALIEQPSWDLAAAGRPVGRDARRVDLRPGPGGAEPDRLRGEVLPARVALTLDTAMNAITASRSAHLDAPLVELRTQRPRGRRAVRAKP